MCAPLPLQAGHFWEGLLTTLFPHICHWLSIFESFYMLTRSFQAPSSQVCHNLLVSQLIEKAVDKLLLPESSQYLWWLPIICGHPSSFPSEKRKKSYLASFSLFFMGVLEAWSAKPSKRPSGSPQTQTLQRGTKPFLFLLPFQTLRWLASTDSVPKIFKLCLQP